jgi:hypothetical protein
MSACILGFQTLLVVISQFFDFIKKVYTSFENWFWIIIIACLAIIFITIRVRRIKKIVPEERMKVLDLPMEKNMVDVGWYLAGYPGYKSTIEPSVVYFRKGKLYICKREHEDIRPDLNSNAIPVECINNVLIEDAFTFKRMMAPERGEVPGFFLSYLDTKKESDIAFVLIKWKKNLQEYCTSFAVEGPWAMERAVNKRNAIKKIINQEIKLS